MCINNYKGKIIRNFPSGKLVLFDYTFLYFITKMNTTLHTYKPSIYAVLS